MNYENPFKNPCQLPLRYINTWNCAKGVPGYEPENKPFQYKDGDYFVVSITSNGWNYIPNDSQYPGIVKEVYQCDVKDLLIYEKGEWNTYTWDELSIKYTGKPMERKERTYRCEVCNNRCTIKTKGGIPQFCPYSNPDEELPYFWEEIRD